MNLFFDLWSLEDMMDNKMKSYLFQNPYGHLRAGWRIGIYLLFLIPSFLPVIGILKLAGWIFPNWGGEELTSPLNMIFLFGLSFALILAAYFTLRYADKRPFALLGLDFSFSGIREFLAGVMIGGANLVAVVLLLAVSGFLELSWNRISTAVMHDLLLYALAFLAAAAIEELANRGYLFQALCEGTRAWITVILVSLIFSLGHLGNEHMSAASCLFLFIHGILYAVTYLKTRSLWTAIGVHWSWNWFQGPVFGASVSGVKIFSSLFQTKPAGPVFLSGGEFGVEGSILASIVSAGFILFVLKTKWLKVPEKRINLWDQYPGGFRVDPKSLKSL